MTDLRKLAEAAMRKIRDSWWASDDLHGVFGIHDPDADFVAAVSPDVVLGLLDEADKAAQDRLDLIDAYRVAMKISKAENDKYIDALTAERDRLREALEKIKEWSEAYPIEVFPEPDFAKAHEVLLAAGISLDAISGCNMRHVTKGIGDIARAALAGEERT